MRTRLPEIVVVTRDVAVAHAVSLAVTAEWTQCCESFSAALLAIGPESKLLVFDAALDAPLAALLPTLFVEQRPGRRAIVLQSPGHDAPSMADERITVLSWPATLDHLSEAMAVEPQVASAAA